LQLACEAVVKKAERREFEIYFPARNVPMKADVEIPPDRLAQLCRRYGVRELSLFGSALRQDFGPDSDVDVLVEFDPSAQVGFLTLSKMRRELSALVGRRVDLVPKRGLKESIRQAVLDSARVIYAA
jgi:uncharacterized protein